MVCDSSIMKNLKICTLPGLFETTATFPWLIELVFWVMLKLPALISSYRNFFILNGRNHIGIQRDKSGGGGIWTPSWQIDGTNTIALNFIFHFEKNFNGLAPNFYLDEKGNVCTWEKQWKKSKIKFFLDIEFDKHSAFLATWLQILLKHFSCVRKLCCQVGI